MAITRAQQAKQMLQDGGMLVKPRSDGKRPGYAVDTGDFGTEAANVAANESARAGGDRDFSPPSDDSPTGPTDTGDFGSEVQNVAAVLDANRFRGDRGDSFFSKIPTPFNLIRNILSKGDFKNRFVDTPNLKSRTRFLNKIGYGGQFTPEFIKSDLGLQTLRNLGYTTMQDRLDNREDDDDSIPLFPRLGIMAQAPKEDEEPEYINPLSKISSRIAGSRFAASGGGMASLEDMDREAFILGGVAKGLKKAVRGIKKIAKSPIGKAALIGGLGYFGGGGGLPKFLGGKGLGGFSAKTLFSSKNPLLFTDEKLSFAKTMGLSSILALLEGKTEEEKKDILKDYYASQELTPSTTIRQAGSEFDFYNYNLAEGGTPRKEPVAKKVMPLLDMGGMEKDYRAEGGFVPIGRMEKADDVPARLSKNEFVFTADAVRNAGDGDVDKGAEVMYNMMKNLEAGGEVSEESQGLEGARKMFQTSQRLEEVL